MITYSKVRGSMETVLSIETNVDTIYIRSNILAIDEDIFKGWEYDEIQYSKDEYIELLNTNQIASQAQIINNQGAINYILMNF